MKTVVHLSTGDPELYEAVVGNVRNSLTDDTLANDAVCLVANGGGVSLLSTDAPQRERIVALADDGVVLKACRNTLDSGDLSEEDLLEQIEIVPSGIGEVARLQAEEEYSYFKP